MGKFHFVKEYIVNLDLQSSDVEIQNGKIYDVNFTDIVAELPKDLNYLAELEEFKFFNPRFLTANKNNRFGVGFELDYMRSQLESIITTGLINPLIGRIIEIEGKKKIQLIDGHRRKENIQFLINKDQKCFDVAQNKFIGAKELYNKVPVIIYDNLSDYDAFALAFSEEKTKIKFGAEAEIKFVLFCRKMNISEDKIINCLGKSKSWYMNVSNFIEKIEKDDVTLNSLITGEINQTVAKKLAEIDDVEIRHKILNKSKEISEIKAKEKEENIDKSIIKSMEKKEMLKAQKTEAEFFEDEDIVEDSEEKIESVENEIKEKKKKKEKVKPKVVSKDLDEAIDDLNLSKEEILSSDTSKIDVKYIKKEWLDPLKDLQFNNGKDQDGEALIQNLDFLDAIIDLLDCVSKKSGNLDTFLMNWGSKII